MYVSLGLFLIVCSVTSRGVLSSDAQTPSRFDIEDLYPGLSEVGSIERVSSTPCRVTGPYAVAAALEIANFIATGESTVFSVQEIVDCHFRRCKEGQFKEYADWLAVNDRLAAKDKYTDYRSLAYTCRGATSPDALVKIRVKGARHIRVAEFESAITQYGSILACIDTSQTNCYSYSRYREGIMDGESSNYCSEKVLIVGYTEQYYRVRGNKGADWGENGYFRIVRGGNKCGIENNMFVLETEKRGEKPGIDKESGCPAEFPKYCPDSRTCRSASQYCITPVKVIGTARGRRPTGMSGIGKRSASVSSRREFSHDKCSDHPGYPCHNLARHCSNKHIWDRCGGTCGVCNTDGSSKCTDTEDFEGECAGYKRYCRMVPALKIKCQLTCEVPPKECKSNKRGTPGIVKLDPPPAGNCYKPDIPNGRIMNRRVFLKNGEKLLVRCNARFTLVGEPSTCEIQNVYKPDTRRLPACVKMGSELFRGRGELYAGTRNYGTSGQLCDNWLKVAHRGTFPTVELGMVLMQGGNHNYCRNIGGDEIPFCFTRGGNIKEFCYSLPKCGGDEKDRCSAPRLNVYDCDNLYSPADCVFTDGRSAARVKWIWDHCGAMCCSYASCQ